MAVNRRDVIELGVAAALVGGATEQLGSREAGA
jgi:hypothetical protein